MAKTRIIVQYLIKSKESIFLRGEGVPGLSWEKGVLLKQVGPEEWIWESDIVFSDGRFKVLLNDITYEEGDNHPLKPGASIRINPKFSV